MESDREPEQKRAGAGPTPAETDALAWTAIGEAAARRHSAGARALSTFVRDAARPHITPKGDDRTNVIDQGARITYALDPPLLRALFARLEACRLEGTPAHFSERQGTGATPRCGIMLDYDLVVDAPRPAPGNRLYYRLAGALVAALQRDIDFAAALAEGGRPAAEVRLHVFFIVKQEATPLPETPGVPGARYKYGLHVLVPGVQVGRAYKKWLLRHFREEAGVAAALRELGAQGDAAAWLDQNSASVPVLYFGSCKRGGAPYVLGAALEVVADLAPEGAWVAPPVIRQLAPAELEGYNLVAELSLTSEADYAGAGTGASSGGGGVRAPLVRKRGYEPRDAVRAAAQDWGDRSAGGAVSADELLLAEHTLSTLTLHNAEARDLHALLDLLGAEYYTERGRWRDVVFALAGSSEQYKPLAVWFSHKCPRKWADGGLAALDALWADAAARRGAPGDSPLTLRSIHHWARTCDPTRYAEAMARSYFTLLTGYVYDHGGRLQHYMVAKVLHAMLGSKFCVDVDVGARGLAYCWYEFVLPGQAMRPGEVWKWRREMEPDDVHIYMGEKLARVLEQVGEHLEEQRAGAADEEKARYYKALARSFAMSKVSLHNDTFKNGVVRQANYLFRRRGFAEQLDSLPHLFGTLNGVLRLGARATLLDHYHEYPVSRFSPVAFGRLDPARPDPWQRLALDAIADIIVEPDARDWILFHAAQGLSGEPKEGLMLLWEGGGQNGKTSFLRWVAKALGPYADKFNIQLMCCDREDADRPNSAIMRFKHLNYAYSEESNKAQSLNVARMKELVNAGEVSGRDLNSKQETFTMKANVVAASQYSFIVNTTDHGTWRRLRHYTSKAKFRRDPDPASPFEKKDDQRFVRQYPADPQFQAAVLSILVHYYERLQHEHDGQLKNVRAPTIERESEAFRVGQDSLHRWVSQSFVLSPGSEAEYSLGALAGAYGEWYGANVERKRHVSGEVIKEIESSAVAKHLRPAPNGTLVVRGCRLLTPDDMALRPGEEMLVAAEGRGGRSAAEWARDVALAADTGGSGRSDGRAWWEARGGDLGCEGPSPPAATGGEGLDDDLLILDAERRAARAGPARGGPDGKSDGGGLSENELAALLLGGGGALGQRAGYTLDDALGPGGDLDPDGDLGSGGDLDPDGDLGPDGGLDPDGGPDGGLDPDGGPDGGLDPDDAE
jgi:phage/plasmid-associated DNA primase